MSDQEESVDSRTSMVGRKRPRDGSVEKVEISDDGASADETYSSRKRVRPNGEPDARASSPDGGVSLKSAEDEVFQPAVPSTTPEAHTLGWNKGVQSGGMRTSFGAKKQSKYTIQPSLEEEENLLVDEPAAVQAQLEKEFAQQKSDAPTEPLPALKARFDPFNSSVDMSSADQPASTIEQVRMTGAEGRNHAEASSKLFISNPLPSKPTFNNQANPESQATTSIPRPEPPVLQAASKVYENYVDMKKSKTPVCVPAFEFRGNSRPPSNEPQPGQKIPVHTGSAQPAPPALTKKERKAAAAPDAIGKLPPGKLPPGKLPALTRNEIQAAIKAVCDLRNLGPNKTKKLVVAFVPGTFTKKQISAYNGMNKNLQNDLLPVHKQVYERGIAEFLRRKEAEPPGHKKPRNYPESQDPVAVDNSDVQEDSDSYDPETALDSTASASASGSQWNPTIAPAPPTLEDILENLNETELLLQLKYFPTDDGRLYIPRCLFCTQTSHATYDCPASACTHCGENSDHATMSCPRRERCGKCREQGHATFACPSKLIRSRSEAIPCDLCGSSAHIEKGCHMIWRSFFPRPEEIKTVRTFPVDCYTCGKEGHLGPECGLYQGQGNMTWSNANFSRYVNKSSTNQVASGGVDYTIKSKAKKTFTIKGKANDPIELDGSDDDQGFLHKKIKTVAAPKAHIQFGNIAPPSGPKGNQSRSSFAGDSYAPVQAPRTQGGGRYQRERTFSPPPRFDRYPPPPQYNPSGGGSTYQDRPQPPSQPKNRAARRLPAKPKNNNKKAKARQQGGN